MAKDLRDIYIKGVKDPLYKSDVLETSTRIETIVSKIYMILMTNKGDVMADINFGADIPKYLWGTTLPAATIQEDIEIQFSKYIPELSKADYKVNVFILPGKFQDVGVINIDLGDDTVNIVYK
jgi:hypothetical protein